MLADTKKRGFTTFQVICVAATVAAQIAVVQPVIRGVKEQDRLTTCKSNIKNCATAMAMYINDWDSKLPSSVLAADPPGSTPTQTQVINFLTAKGNPWPFKGSGKAVTWAQAMHSYVTPSAVFCPSDTPRTRVSYWYKYAMDLAWRDPAIQARDAADYSYPATQVVFYEHTGLHTGDAGGIRDGVKINIAYMDTHIGTITVRNGPTGYPPSSDERNGAAGIRLGSPMYYNYDNTTHTRHPGVADYIDPTRYSDSF